MTNGYSHVTTTVIMLPHFCHPKNSSEPCCRPSRPPLRPLATAAFLFLTVRSPFLECFVEGVTKYVVFGIWLLFIQHDTFQVTNAAVGVHGLFLSAAGADPSCQWVNYNLFTRSPDGGHLGGFQFLTIMNKT